MSDTDLPKTVTGEDGSCDEAEWTLLDDGMNQIEFEDGKRMYVKCFDESGNVLFHGEVTGAIHIEVLDEKGKA